MGGRHRRDPRRPPRVAAARGRGRRRWTPERFELAFGLSGSRSGRPREPRRAGAARGRPRSCAARSISSSAAGRAAARHRSQDRQGRRADKDVIIGGGRRLQPVLYALAAEQLLGEPVEAGRLYYCTSRGGYEERVVPLDDAARAAARDFAATVAGALARRLPAGRAGRRRAAAGATSGRCAGRTRRCASRKKPRGAPGRT